MDSGAERSAAPVRQQAYELIRQGIIEMRFRPGQQLTERELIRLTNASRSSVREAIRELASEGLVESVPYNKTVVASVSADEAEELYDLRGHLESIMVRKFAEKASDDEIATMKAAFADYAAAEDSLARIRAKDVLYRVLGSYAPVAYPVLSGFNARISLLRAISLARPGRHDESVREVGQMVDAIAARNVSEAVRLCEQHAEVAGKAVLTALEQQALAGFGWD